MQLALECLERSGKLSLRVTGTSMRPAIPSGSRVLIRRAAAGEVQVSDVVLTKSPHGVRLHRLVEIRGSGESARWITRGDNHDACDPPLLPSQILGVSIHVELPERVGWLRRLSLALARRAETRAA